MRRWSEGGEVEADIPLLLNETDNSPSRLAFIVYYRSKRIGFQSNYFDQRLKTYEKRTGGWKRHLNLPFFFSGVICVLAHFALELSGGNKNPAGGELPTSWSTNIAVRFVALAAIIPLPGWVSELIFAAFELPRSASLYAAKHQALLHVDKNLAEETGGFASVLRHVAQVEHFLEHEHREWLRLLLDTEWFL